jgi:hypothetical protein
MDKLQPYRQPMVTALGIFLGFMLNYTSQWIRDAFTKNRSRDILVAIGIAICIALLLFVLFRILKMHYPVEPERFYRITLLLFLVAMALPFITFVAIMIDRILSTAPGAG